MWWVEQYRGNESDERADKLFDYVDAQSEARINAITTDMQLYWEPLQKDMTSRESAITELFKNNEESSKLLEKIFPGMSEKWDIVGNGGKLPGMNANWSEQVIAKNDRFDKPFIRSSTINVEDVRDIDTPHDIDNSNQIEQFDRA